MGARPDPVHARPDPVHARTRPTRLAMRPARALSSAPVGAFTQRNVSEPSGRSTYTASRNSMWTCRLRFSALRKRWISVTAPVRARFALKPTCLARCARRERPHREDVHRPTVTRQLHGRIPRGAPAPRFAGPCSALRGAGHVGHARLTGAIRCGVRARSVSARTGHNSGF